MTQFWPQDNFPGVISKRKVNLKSNLYFLESQVFACCYSLPSIFCLVQIIIFRMLYVLFFPNGSSSKASACNIGDAGDSVRSLGWEEPLEEEMATQCSILAWDPRDRRAWRTVARGVTAVRHDWAIKSTHAHILCRGKVVSKMKLYTLHL